MVKMTMDLVSVEIILESVEWLVGALSSARENRLLSEGMKCQMRQENILVLSLLRLVERFNRERSDQSEQGLGYGRA